MRGGASFGICEMKNLAIGSSQLGGFAKAMRKVGVEFNNSIDYAGIWETGFGYLDLEEDGKITAPDIVPPDNNPHRLNLKAKWSIYDRDHVPCADDYEKIYIIASPSKYFPPIYYRNPTPILLSRDLIRHCLTSWHVDSSGFDHINPWQFRVSPIVGKLCRSYPGKIVFVGAPLPMRGKETVFIEKLRSKLVNDKTLYNVHQSNVLHVKSLSQESIEGSSKESIKIFLPPDHVLCDLRISTQEKYQNGNHWHANESYWCEVVGEMIQNHLF
jgi:hypothetical protein